MALDISVEEDSEPGVSRVRRQDEPTVQTTMELEIDMAASPAPAELDIPLDEFVSKEFDSKVFDDELPGIEALFERGLKAPATPPPTKTAAPEPEDGTVELTEDDFESKVDAPTTKAAPLAASVSRRASAPPVPTRRGEAETGRASPSMPTLRPLQPAGWWEQLFDQTYLRTVWPPTAQQLARKCDFIEKALGGYPELSLLDVGCGLGNTVVELAARGHRVVGLDLSLAMISRAAVEAKDRGVTSQFLNADMRAMQFDEDFDAVLCLDTTFGYFDDAANAEVLQRMHRALKPGGVVLMDVVNRDYVLHNLPHLSWFEGHDCMCMEDAFFDHTSSRLEVKRTIMEQNGSQRENAYSIRLYAWHELNELLQRQGFRILQVSGLEASPGVFLGAHSPRIIVAAMRPELEDTHVQAPHPQDSHAPMPDDPTLVVAPSAEALSSEREIHNGT